MIDPALLARVKASGGNPDCLHCQLSQLFNDHLQAMGADRPGMAQVLNDLAELVGDTFRRCFEASGGSSMERMQAFATFVSTAGERCGVIVSVPRGHEVRPPAGKLN